MLNNKRGELFFTLLTVPGTIHLIGLGLFGACLWHIPSWTEAKKNGTTAQYQAQQMWPQQWFAKLPGGDNYKGKETPAVVVSAPVTGNGGNFVGGNSNPNFIR